MSERNIREGAVIAAMLKNDMAVKYHEDDRKHKMNENSEIVAIQWEVFRRQLERERQRQNTPSTRAAGPVARSEAGNDPA